MEVKKRIPVAVPALNGNEKKYVNECIDSSWISSAGKFVQQFEQDFAAFCGVRHAICCANGTVAIHLPLLAYDLGPEDEVIVPTLTYIATANAVRYCGATPVFADSERDTWNLDPVSVEKKITPRTRGIIVVHLYGHPVDMEPILKIADKHGLFVIEDAAEAHGALCHEKKVGSIGHVGTFSFFGNKIITTGEGGMITTNDDAMAKRIRLLRGQGMDPNRRYWFPVVGYNYRMTNIQAALGVAQLENITWHMQQRKQVSEWYNEFLSARRDLFETPVEKEWATHVYWMYSIILKSAVPLARDEVMQLLDVDGIETRPVFHPLHTMPPYFEEKGDEEYPNAVAIASRGMNLPTHALLQKDDVRYIVERLIFHCG